MSAGTGTITPESARVHAIWDQLEHWLETLAALDLGSTLWSEVFDEADLPPGPCKQTAAIELAEALCTDLRRELLAAGAE